MLPKTPTISRAVIEPRLSTTVLTAQEIRTLMRDDKWIAIESRNAQLVFIEQFAKSERGVTLDAIRFAELFELIRFHLRAIRAKAQRKQQLPYRLPGLSDE
jgi:predicted sulfurtransferase